MYFSNKSGDVVKFPSKLSDEPPWTRGETAADKEFIEVA
jgi:hypothetical protein